MSDQQQQQKPQQPRPQGDRTPVRIKRLIFKSDGPGSRIGIRLPHGHDGRGEDVAAGLLAGVAGDVTTEIEHRPWLRVFHVTRTKRSTRTDKDKAGNDIEVESWIPMGEPFHIPDTWAVSVPADEL